MIPFRIRGVYVFVVDWGDGNEDRITAHDQAQVTHTYVFRPHILLVHYFPLNGRRRYGINQKTAAKWKKRTYDEPIFPLRPKKTRSCGSVNFRKKGRLSPFESIRFYHYGDHDQLRRDHLDDFISAYNFARCLKTGPPYEMQKMDRRAGKVYPKSNPSNTGTKHLVER